MKSYLLTTGALFGLIAIAHVMRIFSEGARLATDPWFLALTVLALALCVWAFLLLRRSLRAERGR